MVRIHFFSFDSPQSSTYRFRWGFEVNIFIAGLVGVNQQEAMTLLVNALDFIENVPKGIAAAATVKVGNALGEGDAARAKRMIKMVLTLVWSVHSMLVCLLFLTRYEWPHLFTSEKKIIHLVVEYVPIVCLFSMFEATQIAFAGVLRGSGKQIVGAFGYIIPLLCWAHSKHHSCHRSPFGTDWHLHWHHKRLRFFSSHPWWFLTPSRLE